MRGLAPYNMAELLSGNIPSITVPQLLNSAPALRRELAILLRSSRPFTHKRKVQGDALLVSHHKLEEIQISTSAEEDRKINYMYISVYVHDIKLEEVLDDGGAMVVLVSNRVVDKIGHTRYPCKTLASEWTVIP